jgi:hypothetical protein
MAAPERFAKKSDLLLQRGHRPYMALSVTWCAATKFPLPAEKRARNRWLYSVAFDPVIEAMPCESDPAPSASGPLCASTSDIELSRYGNGIIASDAEAIV